MTSSLVSYEELSTPEGKKWNALCSPEMYEDGFIRLGEVKGVYARSYLNFYNKIKTFEVKDDDVWIVSFPKTGTTWVQEMTWCILNDLDLERAKILLETRSPYLEITANWSSNLSSRIDKNAHKARKKLHEASGSLEQFDQKVVSINSFVQAELLPSPRLIKSHLHKAHLPTKLTDGSTKAKIIYVTRNPKAVCVSFYHHLCLLDGYGGSLEEFADQFLTDNVYCAPFWPHVKAFWDIKDQDNILFLKYEDLKQDLVSEIKKVATFLGKSLDQDQISILTNHLSFETMKNNLAVNKQNGEVEMLRKIHGKPQKSVFMRKGLNDTWKEELSPELVKRFDAWIEKNHVEGLY